MIRVPVKAQEVSQTDQEQPSKIISITTQNPNIATEDLMLVIKPLTKEELEVEVQEWLDLLKLKVEKVSETEIAINQQNQQIDNANNKDGTSDENLDLSGLVDRKKQLVARSTELQVERDALIERFNIILDELILKGGKAEDYQQYVQAVSGVEIDITDTDGLWFRISTWLTSKEGGLSWGFNILKLISIILFCLLLGWLGNLFYETTHRKYLASRLDNQIEPIFKRVVHLGIWGIVGIITLSSLGFNVSAVIASLGIGGLALALAAQDTVANLFGGVMLLVQRPIKVGDRIEIDGIKAKVVEIGLRTTTIKELDYDYLIFVPNAKFASNAVSNIDTRPYYSNYVILHLCHTNSMKKIELALDLIKEIANNNKYVRGARPSFDKIGDYSFDIKFVYWINKWKPEEQEIFPSDLWKIYLVKSQINTEIIRQFENHGIKLALPIFTKLEPALLSGKGVFEAY